MNIESILLPTRPQPDTIVAIFLLQTFGKEAFPGVDTATIHVQHDISADETFESLLSKGMLAIDVGKGPFDHHGTDFCASELIARYLKIDSDRALQQLLEYARRDDREGKGTMSTDAIDRAFGLSGLIASLNKLHVESPTEVVQLILPLLKAYYHAANQHHNELPREVEDMKGNGTYQEFFVTQGKKKLKVACVISDKPSMPTFLRSYRGPHADIVIQKLEGSNHISVLTRQERQIDLSKAMAFIRLREAELRSVDIADDPEYLSKTGRIDEVPYWYYDPATNSLLNGGPHNRTVQESVIQWEELKIIIRAGIELGGQSAISSNKSTYYLSLNIPFADAQKIASSLSVPAEVKTHKPENHHITLEYFGQKSSDEITQIAEALGKQLATTSPFELSLNSADLKVGAPEGYSHAWFLDLGNEIFLNDMRNRVLNALGMPPRDKLLHLTLATKRDAKKNVPDEAVVFSEPFELQLPISELVLVESREENGRKTYVPHTTYKLTK